VQAVDPTEVENDILDVIEHYDGPIDHPSKQAVEESEVQNQQLLSP
jgi:hypothetical protein